MLIKWHFKSPLDFVLLNYLKIKVREVLNNTIKADGFFKSYGIDYRIYE